MQTQTVVVTVPSKTILLGEHSVVYGEPALVSALDRRLSMTSVKSIGRQSDDLSRPCLLVSGMENSTIQLSRMDIENFLQSININQEEPTYLNEVKEWMSTKLGSSVSNSTCDSCVAVLVIFTHDGLITFDSLEISVESAIPMGSGLGSSAALSVAAAASCLVLEGKLSSVSDEWSTQDRERISELAYLGETVFHGSPSGLDNTIATFGGFLSYQRDEGMTLLETKMTRRILVIDTKVPRRTRLMVQGVRARRDASPVRYDSIFAEIGSLVTQLASHLTASDSVDEERVPLLVKRNQELLKEIGVSHPVIDEVVQLLSERGISAKLTGAGGGGCVIAFLPSAFSDESAVIGQLKERGLEVWSANLGAEGVRVVVS